MSNRILIVVTGGLIDSVFIEDTTGELVSFDVNVIVRDFDIEGSEGDCAEEGSLYDIDGSYAKEYEIGTCSWDQLEVQPLDPRNRVKLEDLEETQND